MYSISNHKKLVLNLILVYIIWGSTYLGVKICLESLSPLFLTFLRFIIAGSILMAFSLFSGQKTPSREEIKGSIYLGVLFSGIGTGTIAYAIKYIPSGIVALLVALLPLWAAIIDFLFFSRKIPNGIALAGLILGIIGISFLINPFEDLSESSIPFFPLMLVFVGCISWAFAALMSPKIKQAPPLQTTAIQMLSGGLFALLISLITESHQLESLISIKSNAIFAIAYLVLIGSLIGYSAFLWLVNHAPPILASTYAYVNPVVAIFLGWMLGGEKLTSQTLWSSAIILIGVVLMTLSEKR
jgi:drug/metabolite transporter (DMT)-like permease